MKIKDEQAWRVAIDSHQDEYSKDILVYAQAWAEEMERRMDAGEQLEDIAHEASHAADADIGITGSMYGHAVMQLAIHWQHGEALRRWHNARHGVDGAVANETGGIIDPAIMTVGGPDRAVA